MAREIDFTVSPRLPGRAYNGANGKKIAVDFEGAAWILKFPPSAAEKPTELSYTNRCFSEHLGFETGGTGTELADVPYLTELPREFYSVYLDARRRKIFDWNFLALSPGRG